MFELNKGNLYMTVDDKTISMGEGIPFTEELELSAQEHLTHYHHFDNTMSVTCEVDYVNLTLLNDLCNTPSLNKEFVLEYETPIMIQARWHKRSRIRKKWLKRYGMKQDTVKMRSNAKTIEYHPGHILDNQCDHNGICATFDSFDFETDKFEYIWRPDQKRRGLKIEW